METYTFIALLCYFALMLAIGLYAYAKSAKDLSGYLLGGRQLGPAVTALSAGASDMSGWIIMGLPGAMYLSGLHNIWIAIGLVIGAYLNYLLVAPRLRIYTEVADDAITLPDFFEKRFQDRSRLLRMVAAVVIIVFFTLYTSSGLVGGGKLFETAFGQSYQAGILVTAGVVVLYTLFGGFMAVSMTDFVQGCIMLVALVLVPLVVLTELGGGSDLLQQVKQVDPLRLQLIGGAGLLGVVSAMAWGLGYFGQPHIIVRFMAIRSVREIAVARRIGMGWMILSLLGALATGFVGIAYVAGRGLALADAETVFILLSQVLFHPLITGFLLAAILAAIMSTISSQLLVTSSSLTEDIYKTFLNKTASQRTLVLVGRLTVILVAAVAVVLASNRDSSILRIVSNAWAGFGAAFGPLILFGLYWKRMNTAAAAAGMLVGAATVLVWVYAPIGPDGEPLSQFLYEIVPGFLLSSIAIVLVTRLTGAPAPQVTATFEAVQSRLQRELTD